MGTDIIILCGVYKEDRDEYDDPDFVFDHAVIVQERLDLSRYKSLFDDVHDIRFCLTPEEVGEKIKEIGVSISKNPTNIYKHQLFLNLWIQLLETGGTFEISY